MLRTKRILAMAAALVLTLMLGACGSMEQKLAGEWYEEGDGSWAFTLYSDGSCNTSHAYSWFGEYDGKWSLVNGSTLKISPLMDDTITFEIQSLKNNRLELTDKRGDQLVFWSTEEAARALLYISQVEDAGISEHAFEALKGMG